MAKVSEIYGPTKTLEEKDAFIEAQHNTINQLTEQIAALEEKNRQLESMMVKTIPVIGEKPKFAHEGTEEEYIAREQLRMFAQIAAEREFTMEEARKVDIYAKLLLALKQQDKKAKNPAESLSSAQLLKLVEDGE